VPATAVIWVKCFRQTGRLRGAGAEAISPLEKHADFLLGLIEKRPDLTLGRSGFGDAQTQDSWRPHRGLALLF